MLAWNVNEPATAAKAKIIARRFKQARFFCISSAWLETLSTPTLLGRLLP
jgi:hypothetical protein